MRKSSLHDLLASRGAVFEPRVDALCAARFAGLLPEYTAVRNAVGISDFSFTLRFAVPEAGLDVLDRYAAGPVSSLRFGRVLHTMAVDVEGLVEADLYIANDDDKLIVVAESLAPHERVLAALHSLGAADLELEDLTHTTALISVDGYHAWAVLRALFGTDVLGLPYLSIETYELDGIEVKLLRCGKTSEFGYQLLVPAAHATAVWERLEKAGAPFGMAPVGFDTHQSLRLDGRFFNIYEEGRKVRDPLPLGLQWMVDMNGEEFRGKAPLMARRAAGLSKKLVGVTRVDAQLPLEPGTRILVGDKAVAEVVTSTHSPTLGCFIGLALFDVEYAYAGLELKDDQGRAVRTVSLPPFMAKSLTVKLDEV
ncbi:MAG: hypothetical protein MUC50_22945 [Myxococcota bacterium]|jgi:aminomethyltransferase|nr:hypothetical protein [Myxococcota bacterium]